MKNSKLLITALIMLLATVSGCSQGNKVETSDDEMRTRCLGGVEYYLFSEYSGYKGYGFMAPKYKKDGTLSLCWSGDNTNDTLITGRKG